MVKQEHGFSAFYKGGKTQGFFECLHGNERNSKKTIEGELINVYPQEERYGHKQWFAVVLEIDKYKNGASKVATVFLDANSKRFFEVLLLIYENKDVLFNRKIFLEATSSGVRIGLVGQKPLRLPEYNTLKDYGYQRAIFLIEQITNRDCRVYEEQEIITERKQLRTFFTLEELKWLCQEQAKDEGMEIDDFLQNILSLHFLERWSSRARNAGYGNGPDAIMTMMKEEFGYETR